MAGHELIDGHLAALARRLPAGAVGELADGLTETWEHHLGAGLPPAAAARAAIAEFGAPEQIVAAFVAAAPGRRTARMLLATGPLVGACWGATLLAAGARAWPAPAPAAALVVAAVLLAVVAALVVAATSRRSYRRTRLGAAGGCALIALDATMLTAVLLLAPGPAWPMLLAVPASLARIGLTARALPAALTR
ncbi:hypothetical protein GCM10020358_44940 [Amorphoplanes nipponensis]|uniref:Uncharacterized protein n=2 Tax=Actinoplanes nipponensis TaxID=135950 RepID=A0A919JV99_9ACTN|nr:hypothetical protein Ani05nite_71680 [Actinoplanes nipponensis]